MSAHVLPVSYQSLMTNEDSSILDFYPTEFDVDADGKSFSWEGVCKLPFIEEEHLLDLLFVHSSEHLALQFINAVGSAEQNILIKIDAGLSGDINGFVHLKQESENVSESNGFANDLDVFRINLMSCFATRRLEKQWRWQSQT